jgi:hypothetical protein
LREFSHKAGAVFPHRLGLAGGVGACALALALALPRPAHSQASTSSSGGSSSTLALPAPASASATSISYEDRLRFYLDVKTKNFLIEMADKEMILLQTIANVTAEIKQRGLEGLAQDEAGFDLLYKKTQTLTESYTAEMEAILAVIDEISALSRTMERERRYDLVEEFQDLKGRLVAALDHRELYKKAPATKSHVSGLVKEYDVEVDSLLRIYNRLEKFQRVATAKGDSAILPLVEKQKAKILGMVADLKSDSIATPDLAGSFLLETERIATLLGELDKLEKASSGTLDTALEIETVRRNMIAQLDTRLRKLLGLNGYDKPTLEAMFQLWRGARLADYEARAAEYAVMKKSLLETGNAKERTRLLERDLTDGLLNYAAERYRVAELQLSAVMQDYDRYFTNWDAVMFYRAESFYARALYPTAYENYELLLRRYPDSKFLGMALLRLLTIAHTLKWEQPFFSYYERIDSAALSTEEQKSKGGTVRLDSRIVERSRYLAGYYLLNLDRHAEAETALALIPPASRYHFAAQYLRGIVQANLGNLAGALQHFQYLAESEGPVIGLTLTDPTTTLIRNNALMRLGFIHYQRGELENAVRYFEKVSRGAENYDQTLIGLSWTYLKKGDLEKTITATGTVLGNYLSSNYQYEALVLSAHCRRLLEQPDKALENLRYVAHAHGVLELSKEYNAEREQILAQLGEVERMEKAALEHQDKKLYGIISEVRQSLMGMLFSFGYRSNTGELFVDAFSEERQNIYRQLQQLDRLAAEARQSGLIEVERDAIERRNRLVRVLETYQADRSIRNVNYFVDYPLATKESGAAHRRQIVLDLFKEMEAEQERLKQNLSTADRLISEPPARRDINIALDLKAVQDDFRNLKYRMDRFQTWLSSYDVDAVTTDIAHWADLSGFGMSDIAFQEINRREHKIDLYSQNIASIDNILRGRKTSLEQMLRDFDREMRKIEEELLNEQVRLDRLEHDTYFRNSYFDTSESELLDASKLPAPMPVSNETPVPDPF